MNNLNYMRKIAGLPLLIETIVKTDLGMALTELASQADAELLTEDQISTLKAVLATVGQKGSKAGKTAADMAKKLPDTIKKMYKEPEVKAELRVLYKQVTTMLNSLEKMLNDTKGLQERDPELKKEIDLFQALIGRTILTLQARAGLSVAVTESFEEDDLVSLLDAFVLEELIVEKELVEYASDKAFADDFYKLFDQMKEASAKVNNKKSALKNRLRRADFANDSQADELFDLFFLKLSEAMAALKACDIQLQKKL
jgi:hypothetical protein